MAQAEWFRCIKHLVVEPYAAMSEPRRVEARAIGTEKTRAQSDVQSPFCPSAAAALYVAETTRTHEMAHPTPELMLDGAHRHRDHGVAHDLDVFLSEAEHHKPYSLTPRRATPRIGRHGHELPDPGEHGAHVKGVVRKRRRAHG
jgi:hypothetical protein